MKFDDKRIKEILLKENYIKEEDATSNFSYAQKHNVAFSERLLTQGLITKDILGQAIAEYFGMPYTDLNSKPLTEAQAKRIPEEIAKKFRVFFVREDKNKVFIVTDDPENKNLIIEMKKVFPKNELVVTYSIPEDIDANLVLYQKSLETRFSKIIENKGKIAPEILEEIFEDALIYHASDIHFEPRKESVVVRFRVDGVLRNAGEIPKEYYENILNRIKVQSGLRIDEHFATQDGSLQYVNKKFTVDLRTSIIPTVEGEKVVLRVLSAYVEGFSLNDLGLTATHQDLLEQAAKKPFGMILVVGPTGSGKTTTLYALLKLVNNPSVNITTIEDPVEYKVTGVNQIQINQQTGLTFAKGLRSIVRQDPDIILVGEIRDQETAEISVNAALTGHLLYSTFHANDAATAIPRLLDMGSEPFLLASTLNIIVAQRLVRKICDHCRYSVNKPKSYFKNFKYKTIEKYFDDKAVTLYEGKKCDACNHTGFKGRTAIFEFIPVSEKLQSLILESPSTKEIWDLARKEGAQSLFEDGVEKVKSGITTLEELLRIALPPEE